MPTKKSLSAVLSLEARVASNLRTAFGNVEKSVANLSKQARDFNKHSQRLTKVRDHWAKMGRDTARFDAALKATNNTMRKQARILENLKKGRERLNKASAGLAGTRRVATRVAQGGALGVAAIVASQARKVPNMSEQIAQLRKEGVSQADVFDTILPKSREFSKEFNLGISEVIDGFTMLKKAGYDVQPSIEALPNLFKLAKAESLEVADAFKVLNVSSNALGKPMKALERDLDKMSAVTSLTSLTGFDLANAMGAMGSVFASFEQANLDQFLAATIALNKFNTQLTGDEIKTRLRKLPQLIFRLQDPIKQTKDAATELKRLNINTADFWEINPETGNKALKSFDQIFRMFAKRFDEMGIKGDKVAESYGRLIEEIESRDVAVAVTKALQTGAYDKSIMQLTQQLGIADKTRIVMDSLLGSLKAIPAALGRATNLLFFPDAKTDSSIANVAKSISASIDELGVKLGNNRDKIKSFFDIFKAIIPVFTTFFNLITSIPPGVWKWAAIGASSLWALHKVVGAVTVAFNLISGGIALFAGKGALLLAALPKIGAALTAAFAAIGPAGWVILGVGALAGGAALLIKNWNPVKDFFGDLFGDIKREFQDLYDWIDNKPINMRVDRGPGWRDKQTLEFIKNPQKTAPLMDIGAVAAGRPTRSPIDVSHWIDNYRKFTSGGAANQAASVATMAMDAEANKALAQSKIMLAEYARKQIAERKQNEDQASKLVAQTQFQLAEYSRNVRLAKEQEAAKASTAFTQAQFQLAEYAKGQIADRKRKDSEASRIAAQAQFALAEHARGQAKRREAVARAEINQGLHKGFLSVKETLRQIDNSSYETEGERRIREAIEMQTRIEKAGSSLLRHGLNRLGASIISSLSDKAYSWAYSLVSGRGGGKGTDSIVVGSRKPINTQAGIGGGTGGMSAGLKALQYTWGGKSLPYTEAMRQKDREANRASQGTGKFLLNSALLLAGAGIASGGIGAGKLAGIGGAIKGGYDKLPNAVKGKLEEAGTNVGFATAEGLADGLFDRIGGNNVTINNTNTFNIQGEDDEERTRKIMEELNKQTEENQMDAFVG